MHAPTTTEMPLSDDGATAVRRRRTASAISRRALLLGLPLAVGACAPMVTTRRYGRPGEIEPIGGRRADVAAAWGEVYGPIDDERFPIDALDFAEVDPAFLRRSVAWTGLEGPGTVVVDPQERYLYLVGENGRAIRYGVGVGREGFAWNGRATIRRKAEWPTWTPPREMTLRDPEAAKWAAGMPGGPDNPLGARALYLYQGERDTLYRLHGTNDPSSIGQAVSSGCVRLLNHDIIDLHRRVPVGTPVVVLG